MVFGPATVIAAFCAFLLPLAGARAEAPVTLNILGGLDAVAQYRDFEEPFWTREITQLSDGGIRATIRPFDKSGLNGQDVLPLVRLGVVPFATVLAAVAAGDEPELAAVDLPGLNPDIASLRRMVDAFRPRLRALLAERYGSELLAVYTYPAQLMFCRDAFSGLGDLRGRRIRTSSAPQSDLVAALGAVGVVIPFADMADAFRTDVVDCAITGSTSAMRIGLPDLASHVHAMALSWGVSLFVANKDAWRLLPPSQRGTITQGLARLEQRIWERAARDTVEGLDCLTGAAGCGDPAGIAHMVLVQSSDADEKERRRLLAEVSLPRWLERCGSSCAAAWNSFLAPVAGLEARAR